MKHISIPGAPKKNSFQFPAFARLFDEEKETNNAEIPQVLTFILLSAGLRLYGETCVAAAKGRTKTKEVPAGFKDETLRRPADLTTTERALATRRCRRDVTVTLFAFSRAH